jgi:hypothetical protein
MAKIPEGGHVRNLVSSAVLATFGGREPCSMSTDALNSLSEKPPQGSRWGPTSKGGSPVSVNPKRPCACAPTATTRPLEPGHHCLTKKGVRRPHNPRCIEARAFLIGTANVRLWQGLTLAGRYAPRA